MLPAPLVAALLSLSVLIGVAGAPAGAGEAAPNVAEDKRVERLLAELGSDDFDVRERASRELLELGPRAREALRAAASQGDPEVRERVRLVLRRSAWQLPPDLVERLGDFGRSFTDRYLEAGGEERLELLAELCAQASREAEPYVLQALSEDSGPEVMAWAIDRLRVYRDAPALEAALRCSRHADARWRAAAAATLAAFRGEEAVKRLAEMTADRDATVRAAALMSLASLGRSSPMSKLAAEAAARGLGDANLQVRETAVRAAAAVGARGALDGLWPMAEGRRDRSLRAEAIRAIAAIVEPGDAAVTARLLRLLSDEDCIRPVLDALVSMGDRGAAPRVAELLSGPNACAAADALAVIGGPEQFPALRRVRKARESEESAFRAGRALAILGAPSGQEDVAELLYSRDEAVAGEAARFLLALDPERWRRSVERALRDRAPTVEDENDNGDGSEDGGDSLRPARSFAEFVESLEAVDRDDFTLMGFLALHGLHEQAVPVARRCLARQEDEGFLVAMLGEHLVLAGQGREGLDDLRSAVELDGSNAHLLNQLAWFLLVGPRAEFRHPDEALEAANRAAALEPRSPAIADTQAWALFLSGRAGEALKRQDLALGWAVSGGAGSRTLADLELHRAQMLGALGRREEAAAVVSRALKRRPRDPLMAAEGARAWCALGETQKALEQLSRMVDLLHPDLEMLKNDPGLAAAREDKGFARILARAEELRQRMVGAVEGLGVPGADDAWEEVLE